jgi:hypothetical protein
MESMLGRSPSNTAPVQGGGELAVEFQKVEGHHSILEWPAIRICNLLLGPPPSWACLADHLDEAAR